ncbi:hypothetical protein ACFQAT_07195 [Undibacterium arcticum]|uniref:Transposase n=1 Tax=Undibacterium arcticum TaxID=1762892 RepID=A0ABV7EY48_9BURK
MSTEFSKYRYNLKLKMKYQRILTRFSPEKGKRRDALHATGALLRPAFSSRLARLGGNAPIGVRRSQLYEVVVALMVSNTATAGGRESAQTLSWRKVASTSPSP